MNHGEIVSFIWGVADLIRDTFKRGKYQDVILPLTVLRRLDCVLTPTKDRVLKRQAELRGKGLQDLDAQLRRASSFAFYNTSRYDFDKLLADAPHVAPNLRNYIAGFSPNMREVLEKFDFDNTISKLNEAGLLFKVLERFKNVDLHPDKIDNPTMGTIFEELIRRFNEALNENPGEHFTPRDVVHLMVDLMLAGDADHIRRKGVVCTVYDPCCGSGGMLLISKEHITIGLRKNGDLVRPPMNKGAEIHLFGQEVNPETWAVSKSDLFIKEPTGRDADNIAFGSTLSHDRHAQRHFDYLIANPPYGKDWKGDEDAVRAEHERGVAGRFAPGLPRISDGQLLFLLNMLAHMKNQKEGGSRVAIIMNGSPLFTGDAGSGESEIRRFILENDLLEALIALPEQLFYNTGIATYIWVVTNRKVRERRDRRVSRPLGSRVRFNHPLIDKVTSSHITDFLETVRKRTIVRIVKNQGGRDSMAKAHVRLVTPSTVNRTVTPTRRRNGELRTREYLTEAEVGRLMKAAQHNRWAHRDSTMILVAFRHGLRVSELIDLRWDQVDFQTATLHVRRVKQGTPATHPIVGDELRALRRLQREQEPKSAFVFTSERGSPFAVAGFARMVERAGILAKLGFKAHPHMLRHATGYALANKGRDTRALQAYLGHKNIQHTVRYTELSPTRFKDFWR